MASTDLVKLCGLYATPLEYPAKHTVAAARELVDNLGRSGSGAAAPARKFAGWLSGQSLESVEERYTQTFDLTSLNSLYVGFHQFGDTPHRSRFMVELQEAYKKAGHSCGIELPDHLPVILRFLAVSTDAEFTEPLLGECLLPVAGRIESELTKVDDPYAPLLTSLNILLEQINRAMPRSGGARRA